MKMYFYKNYSTINGWRIGPSTQFYLWVCWNLGEKNDLELRDSSEGLVVFGVKGWQYKIV